MNSRLSKIRIQELQCYAGIGYDPHERSFPQRLILSAEMWYDDKIDFNGIDVDSLVNWKKACKTLHGAAHETAWVSVEELSEECATALLRDFPQALSVEVEIRKFSVPGTAWVAATVRRSRLLECNAL